MFSLIDIISICIIIILFFFLIILFHFGKSGAGQKGFLWTAILIIILISIIEELIFLRLYDYVSWVYPFVIAGYFCVYPLIYIHFRNLIYYENGNYQRMRLLLIMPLVIFLFVSVIFYPLDYSLKIQFLKHHIWEETSSLSQHNIFVSVIYPAYYIQTIVYMLLTIKLIFRVRRNIHSKPWELLHVKYFLMFVVAACMYEGLLILNIFLFENSIIVQLTVEQFLSLLFLAFCMSMILKQSLIAIQSRMIKYSDRLVDENDIVPGLQEHTSPEDIVIRRNTKPNLSEDEKKEIKEAIENYFSDSKIYLDANLKLEGLSKKIHITTRRISAVINQVYDMNFNQFINEYRISEAKKILAENPSEVKIEKIYTKVGFNSRSAFNHAFKESTGTSPSEFIKEKISRPTAKISEV